MFYVIVNNNSVIFGPREWNRLQFQGVLEDDLEIITTLNLTNDSGNAVKINDETYILPVVSEPIPEHNVYTQQLVGPFWTINSDRASQTYTVADKSIDEVKNNLKSIIATNRYNKEISGTTVNVADTTIQVSTDRTGKQIYFQYAANLSAPINFKAGSTWLTLEQSDFQTICNAVNSFVQSAFDWESTKITEIDSKTTLSDLAAIDLTYPTSE